DLVVGRHFEHVARQLDGLLELGFADLRAMRAAERGVLEIFGGPSGALGAGAGGDRKSTRLNSSHLVISYAVFCLKKKNAITAVHDAVAADGPDHRAELAHTTTHRSTFPILHINVVATAYFFTKVSLTADSEHKGA